MTKADEMGESSAFSRAGSARSARGRAIKSALEATDPTQLALHLLSHNPDNPREKLGDVTELAGSLRDHGQKTPASIMTRDAYLAANPGREDELEPHAMYVVIDGNRRLAAAREAGLSSLKVMVDDSATDTNELLESALVANIHREAFEPLDEAKALKQLLEIHGTQDKLSKRLHRSQGWVSQRLALLDLTPGLKQRLEQGESVELLRRVGKKPKEQQEELLEKLKREKEAEEAEKAERRAARAKRRTQPAEKAQDDADSSGPDSEGFRQQTTQENQSSSKQNQQGEPSPGSPSRHYGVMKGGGDGQQRPEDRSTPDREPAVVMPWRNPAAVLRILREYMEPADLEQLAKEVLG
ncbi:ParB/RepB/Spo0J family partition protein [Streptomyces hygroscopicus]|uniref:ParB/RepB/Spo0J family partition protein n=1 Tax=Streptomyces hygroscopicus TaxID=1912 RepID=UPI003794E06A